MAIRNGKLLKYTSLEVIIIVNYEDTVELTWTSNNMKYYINNGYKYTKTGEKFQVKIKDLAPGSKAKYPVTCDNCGVVFYRINETNKRIKNCSVDYCIHCNQIKSVKTRMANKLNEQWRKLEDVCEQMGYELVTKKEEYTGCKMKIDYICPFHGQVSGLYNNIVRHHGCQLCARKKNGENQRITKDELIATVSAINNNVLLNPDDYVSAHTKNLKILCGCCKTNTFITSLVNYRIEKQRCDICSLSMSKYEYEIYKLLNEFNIKFTKEKTFEGCVDKGLLFFDFYLHDYITCIEYDGEQHYNDNYYRTMKYPNPELCLKELQRRDAIKTQFCKDNNIKLIRIPYWESKNIREIITKELGIFK